MTAYSHSPRLMARRAERDFRQHRTYATHRDGLCAMPYGLCGACAADELAEMTAWALTQPDPLPGEDCSTYWRRIGGAFYDSWYEAARARGAA
jgi:hypothetical protein